MSGEKEFIFCVCQGTCPSSNKIGTFGFLSGGEIENPSIAACDPQTQCKMFRNAFEAVGFDKSHHIPLDIRNQPTGETVVAIKQLAANP